ncbi:Mite allergen Eur m 3 [Frankliniella fusca]|uniref:Mite allergen Eur m 3 n=1 Tax=Frankliniella fusca TaxID=407009 RepID=A0AAE1HUE7_9NEOP|nr:Mite allergen Eur m 3 [Frankliniella fusca]
MWITKRRRKSCRCAHAYLLLMAHERDPSRSAALGVRRDGDRVASVGVLPKHTMTMPLVLALVLMAAALSGGWAAAATGQTETPSLGTVTGGTHVNPSTLNEEKIVGGTGTTIQMRPYMVSIAMRVGKTYELQCGATILDASHVLTAAHCLENKNLSLYQLRAGSTSHTTGGQVRTLSRIGVPTTFNEDTYDYDVAVLKLSKPLILDGKTTRAVDLVKAKTPVKVNTKVVLIGWGFEDTSHSLALPTSLQEVEVDSIDRGECSADYEGINTVTDRMFCVMSENRDSCQGDSGGPAINKATGQQMGIISWAKGCAQMGYPGVYTDLANSQIRSFIDGELKK